MLCSELVFEINKNKLDFTHLECPICMDFTIGASTTLCGHMFCERCISEWMLFNKDCPVCRRHVRTEAPYLCPMMNSIIESYLDQSELKKERENYKDRKERYIVWKNSMK